MKFVDKPIRKSELVTMAEKMFGQLVKAVLDIDKQVMVVDAGLHADEETYLLENGSIQKNLWGINLYPQFEVNDDNFIEFDSMINLRPNERNFSRSVENEQIQQIIIKIVKNLVTND